MSLLAIDPLKSTATSATDQVFDALYQAVISVKLPPGTKVSEAEIAQRLGVSRQPVRDAFFRLSNLGFLEIRPQRATLITHISRQAVLDALFVRVALEAECLRVAICDHRAALLSGLEASVALQQAALSADTATFHQLDEAFHEAICTIPGHGHTWSLIRAQKAHLDRIRFLTLSEDRQHLVVREHGQIVEAVRAGDAGAAEAALRQHLMAVQPVVDTLEQEYPDYFEPRR